LASTPDQYANRFPNTPKSFMQIEFHRALEEPKGRSWTARRSPNNPPSLLSLLPPIQQWFARRESAATIGDRWFRRPQVEGYDVLEEIGRGGMGVVFKAAIEC
jgi:hypothetical protein